MHGYTISQVTTHLQELLFGQQRIRFGDDLHSEQLILVVLEVGDLDHSKRSGAQRNISQLILVTQLAR